MNDLLAAKPSSAPVAKATSLDGTDWSNSSYGNHESRNKWASGTHG